MRLRNFTIPIYEFVLDRAVVPEWASKKPVMVHKNPTRDELVRVAGEYQTTRGFLVDDGLIVWGMVIHTPIAEALGMRDDMTVIPILMYTDGYDAVMTVTDYVRFTKWNTNPRTAGKIRKNPYIKKMFGDRITINYWNEHTVGDWEKL